MPRKPTPIVTGELYHVFNRGVDKRTIFESRKDYLRFYQSLEVFNTIEPVLSFRDGKSRPRKIADRLVQFHAYALLPNHFHFILEQLTDGGISEFMKRVQGGYTLYFNEEMGRSGSLFQGKFKRIHIDSEAYLQYLKVYVNENHFVHQIDRGADIFYASSLHYQNEMQSKLLLEVSEKYSQEENQQLAQEIAMRREIAKTEL